MEAKKSGSASQLDLPALHVPDYNEILMGDMSSNCAVQSVMATVGGGVMGLLFGIFMGSMEGPGGNAMLQGVQVRRRFYRYGIELSNCVTPGPFRSTFHNGRSSSPMMDGEVDLPT